MNTQDKETGLGSGIRPVPQYFWGQTGWQIAVQPVGLYELVQMQSKALRKLLKQNCEMEKLIHRIDACGRVSDNVSTRATSSTDDNYSLKVALDEKLPCPLLKERGFPLTGSIKDSDGGVTTQSAGMKLTVQLFAADNPTRALTHNIAGRDYLGKKALRGTLTTSVQSDGRFVFRNIVIAEVSSHYLDDAFTIVVSADQRDVKPLVIRKVVVRARKAKAAYLPS